MDGVVMATLKKRYFEVVLQEDYPRTPKLTDEADRLEQAIKEIQDKQNAKQQSSFTAE